MKDRKATILINLKQSKEEMFNKFSKDLRWGIRRAEKENLRLEEVHNDDSWRLFKLMFKKMWWSVNPKIDQLVEEWKLNKSRRLFFVYKNFKYDNGNQNIIVGFAVVKDMPDRLNMEYLSHAHKDYIALRINDFLYWNLILKAKGEGKPYFDVGGYQLDARGRTDKVNKYKLQFNGELVVTEVHGSFFYILGRKLVRRFPWITIMRKKMQGYKFND